MGETTRQLVHIAIGLVAIFCLLAIGRGVSSIVFFAAGVAALLVMHLSYGGVRIPIADQIFHHSKRGHAEHDFGPLYYFAGLCLVFTFLHSFYAVLFSLVALGIGDGVSTLVGVRGTHKLAHNSNKTLEGSAAFFLVCMPSIYFLGASGLVFSLAATCAESLDLRLDDNLVLAIVCIVVFSAL